MVNGELPQNNNSFPDSSPKTLNRFSLLLAPELSYMATNHLMLGGKLGIGLNGNVERRFASENVDTIHESYLRFRASTHLSINQKSLHPLQSILFCPQPIFPNG